jgi:anthranilate/para-aminobenzoate synthase component II
VCLGHQAIGQAYGGKDRACACADARQAVAHPPFGQEACSAASKTAFRRRATTRW